MEFVAASYDSCLLRVSVPLWFIALMYPSRVPLAWLNLTHDRRRFVVSVAGITFAVLLMFMQIGFLNALVDGTVEVIRRFDADLVITSATKYTFSTNDPFTRRRLYEAEAVPGVISARPLYVEYRTSLWKNIDPNSEPPRHIRVLAFDPRHPALLMPEVVAQCPRLEEVDTAIIDMKSKDEFEAARVGIGRELADHSVRLIGTFHLGTDFVNDGNLIVSDRTFGRVFPFLPAPAQTLDFVEVGLVRLESGLDLQIMKKTLGERLAPDVMVLTRGEYVEMERQFWLTHAPIGFIFGLGTAIGFIVGMVICYQILSTDVADHIAEYATLKAIGYPNMALSAVVLQEALCLSILGYLPGLLATAVLYSLLDRLTGLPMALTVGRAGLILVLTVVMCVTSGFLALRKVQAADPAEVF
jgi:putative ABC transport system permease protein